MNNIRKGFWHIVLKQIQYITIEKYVLLQLYDLIIKELLIAKEFQLAQFIIKDQTVSVLQEYPDQLQQLWDLTSVKEPPHTFQSLFGKHFKNIEESRESIIKLFEKQIVNESQQSNRLIQLITQGLAYEKMQANPSAFQMKQYQEFSVNNKISKQVESRIPFAQKISSYKKFSGDFQVQTITISHDSKYLVIGGKDGLIEVWNYDKMELDMDLPYQAKDLFMLHRRAVLALSFSQDDKILASGDQEGLIRIWKFSDAKKLREIDTQGGEATGICAIALTSNNSQLVAGCLDSSIKLYGLKSGNLMRDIKCHQSFILQIYFMAQRENLLMSGYEDSSIILWNLTEQDPKAQKIKIVQTPDKRLQKEMLLNNFEMHPTDSKLILVCLRYKSAYLMNYETDQIVQEFQSNQSKDEEMLYARFSGDGSHVYAYSTNKNLYVFDTMSGKLEALVLVPNDKVEINGMNVSSNKKMLQETLVLYSLTDMFKLDSNLNQTQSGVDPFLAKKEINRTLYKPDKNTNQKEYFPWGTNQGGAGDPFRDHNGNIITNKKAAVAYQEKFQSSAMNYVSPSKQLYLRNPHEAQNDLQDLKQNNQSQYYQDLKRQIEE
eukprot:403339996